MPITLEYLSLSLRYDTFAGRRLELSVNSLMLLVRRFVNAIS